MSYIFNETLSVSTGIGVGGTPISGGADKEVLFNRGGVLGGDTNFEWDYNSHILDIGPGGQIKSSNGTFINQIDLSLSNANAVVQTMLNVTGISGTVSYEQASVFGTRDILVQCLPDTNAGWTVFEGNTSAGVVVSTVNNANPILFSPNRTEVQRITATGIQVTSSGSTNITANFINSNGNGSTIQLTATTGHSFQFSANGSGNGPGIFSIFDGTAGTTPFAIDNSTSTNPIVSVTTGGLFAWSSNASFAGISCDTGISRSAAAVIAFGNGTAGNTSGTLKGNAYVAFGDPGGTASSNTVSGTNSTTISTGTGTVKMSSVNNANNTGWLKCYVGTQVAWVPCWTTNAP